jgi:glycosyltransferase involved in cell wall biosynthesis
MALAQNILEKAGRLEGQRPPSGARLCIVVGNAHPTAAAQYTIWCYDLSATMKIALVSRTFSFHRGGAERYALDLAERLCQLGHEVHLFATDVSAAPAQAIVHQVRAPRWPAWWRVLRWPYRIRAAVEAQRCDAVCALTEYWPADVCFISSGVHRYWLLHIHHPNMAARWLHYLIKPVHLEHLYHERRALGRGGAARIVTNSRLCKDMSSPATAGPSSASRSPITHWISGGSIPML